MVKAFINGIFKVMISFASIFTSPISSVLNTYLPVIGDFVSAITNLLNIATNGIAYFWVLIPPVTRFIILAIFGFYVTIYPLRVLYANVVRGLDIIKRINIFSGK